MEQTHYVNVFENGVAVIDLIGPIYPRANMMTASGATSIEQFTRDFVKAYNDPDVKGIVMNVDSPGGAVMGVGDAATLINAISKKGKKPIMSFASGYMCSAAYYVAASAQKINGSESSLTGSIGCVLTASKKGDGEVEIVSSQSKNKRPDVESEDGRAVLQRQVDGFAEIFIKDISKFRGIDRETVLAKYGQGESFVGPDAKRQGLIDKISTLAATVEEVASMAQSKGSNKVKASEDDSVFALLKFSEEEDDNMGLKDLFTKFTASNKTVVLDDEQAQGAPPVEGSDTATEGADQGQTPPAQPKITRAELEENVAFSNEAELFVTRLTIGSKIQPAQASHVAADYFNAKIDDTLYGDKVKFSDEKGQIIEGSRVQMVEARYNALPKHTLTERAITAVKEGSSAANILAESKADENDDNKPMTAERRTKLLGLSQQGMEVLQATGK